jgi:membrane protease YdiL (CAAX protease family)
MLFADHLLAVILAVVYPVAGYISFRRLLRRIEAGEAVDRTGLYLNTIAGHWTLFTMVLLLWRWAGRDWNSLGFGLAMNVNFVVGAVLTTVVVIMLAMQNRRVAAAGADQMRDIRGKLGRLEIVIPRNGNELGRFYGLSLTAGIVEETLWRGFMIWYFSQFLPLWAAALVSVIGFGLAHAYQGFENLPKITLIGALFALLFLLTGSLWLPMILHAAVDILQGRMAYDIIRRSDDETPAKPGGDAIATSAS